VAPETLVGMAVRRNPRRAHLLVSTVLGKHVPADPRVVLGTGLLLGARVQDLLGPAEPTAGTVVVGFAETATGLGQCVAAALGARSVHSTRRRVEGMASVAAFHEEHSHAVEHRLLPEDQLLLAGDGPIVLVDDELSTGQTALNMIRALHRAGSGSRWYVLATLVDLRSNDDHARLDELAAELGLRLDVVALSRGRVELPPDALARGAALVQEYASDRPATSDTAGLVQDVRVADLWPTSVREGGRHGFAPGDEAPLEQAAVRVARRLADLVRAGRPTSGGEGRARVLVLGTEELMYAPLRIATALADELDVFACTRFSSTTRSPVIAIDDPGYAIRTALTFDSHDERAGDAEASPQPRYAYNVHPGSEPDRRFTDIVLVLDDMTGSAALDGPTGLREVLSGVCDRLFVITLPCHQPSCPPNPASALPAPLYGPEFGSYVRADVGWLLTDLSAIHLEAPIEEREEAIQSGEAHYAETLPIEFQPGADYLDLFEAALAASSAEVAHAVGVVTEQVLARRGPGAVLVSLARAGTPVGILMRRWAAVAHDLDVPHYTLSIVRGRGIDLLALRYLAAHHDPKQIVFVDGWTGKGTIADELASAVAWANIELGLVSGQGFSPDLAVLADTAGCVEVFGTRADFLVPSACLNSTVSGLVSRTVLSDALIGPSRYHGAKFYAHLAGADVSGRFIDAVESCFDEVAPAVQAEVAALASADRAPTWSGRRAVEQISRRYGIDDINLIKPGVGETTRVLLRRVPWKVLIHPDAVGLGHIWHLARQRGVEVELVPDLAYSCVGLIHPGYIRPVASSLPADGDRLLDVAAARA
jgi:adenine/guanine phosphoribosyltransferase-like PRPP-binding protein